MNVCLPCQNDGEQHGSSGQILLTSSSTRSTSPLPNCHPTGTLNNQQRNKKKKDAKPSSQSSYHHDPIFAFDPDNSSAMPKEKQGPKQNPGFSSSRYRKRSKKQRSSLSNKGTRCCRRLWRRTRSGRLSRQVRRW